jgi:hypothetical protein
MTIHGAQTRQPWPIILDDLANAARDPVALEHFQNDVFGTHPVGKLPGEPTPQMLGIVR